MYGLKYLTDNNFMTLKMRDLELYVDGKVQIRENSVVLTIDDGDKTIYTLAQPIIEKYGVNVTVFAITSLTYSLFSPNINSSGKLGLLNKKDSAHSHYLNDIFQ